MKFKAPPQGAELRRLVLEAQAGNIESRNEMIVRNMGLVAAPAKWYARRSPGIILDDLMQAGRIGLVRAVEKFDVDAGNKFSTYAMWWVRQELRRIIRIENARGVSAKMRETSDFMEGRMSPSDRKAYEEACMGYIPLDSPAGGDTSKDLVRDIVPSDEEAMEEATENKILFEMIKKAIADGVLNSFESDVLFMHYGIEHDTELSLKQIRFRLMRKDYELTELGLQNMIEGAIEKLRSSLGSS